MNPSTMFSCGLELANLVASSDLLHNSWAAILKLYRETNPSDPHLSIKYRVYDQQPLNDTIIVFVSSPPCTTQNLQVEGRDLVSSSTIRESFPFLDFVSTKVNPSSIHRVAVTLFASLLNELSFLKDQCGNISPLIVTGHSIAGSVASLFTLWLLKSTSPKSTKHPLCITFGSPLMGDKGFQQAILEHPTWNSCFLHVVSNYDPIPKLFASVPHNVLNSTYKPFGTFLWCSNMSCAFFEEPESVLDLMVEMCPYSVGHRSNEIVWYGDVLEKLQRGTICRGVSDIGEWDISPLHAGILIQIEAIKVERSQGQLENDGFSSVVRKIEKKAKDFIACKTNVFDPSKKLNEMKINMTYLEWYKKVSVSRRGYYDVFKNLQSKSREEIVKRKNILTHYWDKMVKEATKMPQKEGQFLHPIWLYGGTYYRRMVEPLDIAEYYRKGKKDYLAAGRSEHYKLLEQWEKHEKPVGHQSKASERNRVCSLTKDSCFWAHVEEAIVSCKLFQDGEICTRKERESSQENLVKFENYVMDLITDYAVSSEIFLKQSSFMKWWETYEKIKELNEDLI
ncbi:senescence-associated carboxylesterase 101-like isoform X2 [Actinidia eriantha]|uniref:senescence-associated carboxylesterase 101-like isoform X2 n=1 Tax=Actinidia eriantha TaxID=165200 RepID=UPI002583F33E|nr:senescence-associated carboxylesterase 101-like isoform X2 [Actinidia eriantha]XP_057459629.1 senescence-associated carboxylesterase 101-like isoform X2 [Actinidia eriantha]